MASAYIAYTGKKGLIKCVSVEQGGEIDELGIQLMEYFKDFSDVRELTQSSLEYIEDGEAVYLYDLSDLSNEDYEFEEYVDKDDFTNSMWPTYYYLFENDRWYVAKPNCEEFKELETVLEEEY